MGRVGCVGVMGGAGNVNCSETPRHHNLHVVHLYLEALLGSTLGSHRGARIAQESHSRAFCLQNSRLVQ